MPSISYAITACNEHEELNRLLIFLESHVTDRDEIIIQIDSEKASLEVKQLVEHFNVGRTQRYEFHRIFFPLNGDFSAFKNNLSNHCSRDYIFQIDADEIPHEWLLQNLSKILTYNPDVDVYLVPRINTVKGITDEHIQKWNWRVDKDGWVNFPDYQWRIWKNRVGIKWVNKVHERLDGFSQYVALPSSEEFCLYHPKTIERLS